MMTAPGRGSSVTIPGRLNPVQPGQLKPVQPPAGKTPDKGPGSDDYGSELDLSYLKTQLKAAKQAEATANQAYKDLLKEHKESQEQLKDVNRRIIEAQMAQKGLVASPAEEYSKLQQKTLQSMGLGMSSRQSFGFAGLTVLLGLIAIIGRVE